MTDGEKLAVELLAQAWNAMIACGVANAEAMAHIHALQHAVMAQPTARAYPEMFRQQIDELHRRREALISLRENMNLVARVRTGTGLGSITETLSDELVEQLKPIVDADLSRQIAEVGVQMRGFGVEVD